VSEGRRRTGWSWKVADTGANEELGLLYEPGTWGDVLKALWVLPLAEALAARGAVRILDPFAGAATYPLVQATADRLVAAPDVGLDDALEPHLQAGRFPSTGVLALEAARAAGAEASARVFDVDARRRERWRGHEGVELLEVTAGDEALERHGAGADLLLVDPYDLFERRDRLVPGAFASCGPEACVLLYLFNKAPRGAKAHRAYRDLRARLDEAKGAGRRVLVGRIPSDAVLPRAYHEVLLACPGPLVEALEPTLKQRTLRLSRHLCDAGAFEVASLADGDGS
jgi:hypothetical protein